MQLSPNNNRFLVQKVNISLVFQPQSIHKPSNAWIISLLLIVLLSGCDNVNVQRQAPGETVEPVYLRINAGGDAYTDENGVQWLADRDFSGGVSSASGLGVAIEATEDDLLYQVQRLGSGSGQDINYAFEVPNASYVVRLHFAEVEAADATIGERVFNVLVEDQVVLSELDPVAQTGGSYRALVRQLSGLSTEDGELNLQFEAVTGSPAIAAIEVLSTPPTTDLLPPTAPASVQAFAEKSRVLLQWSPAVDDDGRVVAYNVYRDGTRIATTSGLQFQDTGLDTNTIYSYGVSAIDDALPANESGQVMVSTQTLEGSATSAARRINAGGDLFVDSAGRVWQADAGFNDGNSGQSTTTEDIGPDGMEDDVLFQRQRFDRSGGQNLQYNLTLSDGDYQVRLLLAETIAGNFFAGAREFGVTLEGQTEWASIDIFAAVGGNQALELLSGVVTVSDGVLNIGFERITGNPTVAAIEVLALTPTGVAPLAPVLEAPVDEDITSAQVDLRWSATTDPDGQITGYRVYRDDGTSNELLATVTGTSYSDDTAVAGSTYSYTITALDDSTPSNESPASNIEVVAVPGTSVEYRINVGGAEYTDSDGNRWAIDYDTQESRGFYAEDTRVVNDGVGKTITGTADAPLFQSQRRFITSRRMYFRFPVAAGDYDVVLYFAETQTASASPGARVFDVAIEDQPVLTNFDIFSEAGGANQALERRFYSHAVTDGELTIELSAVAGQPLVAAVEILALNPVADNTPPTTPTNLRLVNAKNTEISFAWDASSDADGEVAKYRIYRDNASNLIATVSDTSYVDTGLNPGTTYQYFVTALDNVVPNANESAPASASIPTTNVPDITPPSQPLQFDGQPLLEEVYLQWLESTDDQEVTEYQVSRDGVVIANLNATYFTDTGLVAGVDYSYEVRALDGSGNQSSAASLSISTLPVGTTVAGRINVGGTEYTDSLGNVWIADVGFNFSLESSDGLGQDTGATDDDFLYQTQRWTRDPLQPLSYRLVGPNGNYRVRLHFSEDFEGVPGGPPGNFVVGGRVFNITIEGVLLANFDIYDRADGTVGAASLTGIGYHKVVAPDVDVTVFDGALNINFGVVEDSPTLSAIEIFRLP